MLSGDFFTLTIVYYRVRGGERGGERDMGERGAGGQSKRVKSKKVKSKSYLVRFYDI